jgi:hypothetical protein
MMFRQNQNSASAMSLNSDGLGDLDLDEVEEIMEEAETDELEVGLA